MDFATRDQYRHAVEKMAKRSRLSEGEVAQHAILLARTQATEQGDDGRAAHVGFYLIDKGQSELEQAVGMRLSLFDTLKNRSGRHAVLLFLGSIVLMTTTFTSGFLALAYTEEWDGWILALIGLLSALAASQLAVTLVNWLTTSLVTPHPL